MLKNKQVVIDKLDRVLEAELSGVVRYLHYSFMIFGPNRIPITSWFRNQALEGFNHAVTVGERITSLGGHPSVRVQSVPETNNHSVLDILRESLEYEKNTVRLYHDLLEYAKDDIPLDEMVRTLISSECNHVDEVEKMIKHV